MQFYDFLLTFVQSFWNWPAQKCATTKWISGGPKPMKSRPLSLWRKRSGKVPPPENLLFPLDCPVARPSTKNLTQWPIGFGLGIGGDNAGKCVCPGATFTPVGTFAVPLLKQKNAFYLSNAGGFLGVLPLLANAFLGFPPSADGFQPARRVHAWIPCFLIVSSRFMRSGIRGAGLPFS